MRCSLKKTNLKLAIFQRNEIKYVIFKKEKWCVQHPAAGGSCQRVEQLRLCTVAGSLAEREINSKKQMFWIAHLFSKLRFVVEKTDNGAEMSFSLVFQGKVI